MVLRDEKLEGELKNHRVPEVLRRHILSKYEVGETIHVSAYLGDFLLKIATEDLVVVALWESWILGALHRQWRRELPPKPAEFLLLLIPIRQREHVLGDLEEEFRTILIPKYGIRVARLIYWWHVLLELGKALTTGLTGAAVGWLISKFTK